MNVVVEPCRSQKKGWRYELLVSAPFSSALSAHPQPAPRVANAHSLTVDVLQPEDALGAHAACVRAGVVGRRGAILAAHRPTAHTLFNSPDASQLGAIAARQHAHLAREGDPGGLLLERGAKVRRRQRARARARRRRSADAAKGRALEADPCGQAKGHRRDGQRRRHALLLRLRHLAPLAGDKHFWIDGMFNRLEIGTGAVLSGRVG